MKEANKKKKKIRSIDPYTIKSFTYDQFSSGGDLQVQSSSVEKNRFSRRAFTKDVRKGRRNGRKGEVKIHETSMVVRKD